MKIPFNSYSTLPVCKDDPGRKNPCIYERESSNIG